MSVRPAFIPEINGKNYVRKVDIEFTWFPGFSKEQKRKSIRSLHKGIKEKFEKSKILEISTKSEEKIGIKASAFNLRLCLKELSSSIESIYQGSKVFELGGPYLDLYKKSSLESKKDERLKSSGDLKGYDFYGDFWKLNDNFYNWLYLNALDQNEEIKQSILSYDVFTDIEFNPKKSYNCQAYSAALFSSIIQRGESLSEIKNKEKFKKKFSEEIFTIEQMELF
jgi:hypothetical protein